MLALNASISSHAPDTGVKRQYDALLSPCRLPSFRHACIFTELWTLNSGLSQKTC